MSTCNVSTSSNYMQVIIGANNYILQKNMDQIYYVPYKLLINKIRMQCNAEPQGADIKAQIYHENELMCTLSIQDGKTISYDYIINRTINDMEKLTIKIIQTGTIYPGRGLVIFFYMNQI